MKKSGAFFQPKHFAIIDQLISEENPVKKAKIIIAHITNIEFKNWLKKEPIGKQIFRNLFSYAETVNLLRSNIGNIVELLNFNEEEKLALLYKKESKIFLLQPMEFAILINQCKARISPILQKNPNFRETIIECLQHEKACIFLRNQFKNNLNYLLNPFIDTKFSLKLLSFDRGSFLSSTERLEIINHLLNDAEFSGISLISSIGEKLKPQEILFILFFYKNQKRVLNEIKKDKLFNEVVFPVLLDHAITSAKLLSSSLVMKNYSFVDEQQVKDILLRHQLDHEFAEELKPVFYNLNHVTAECLFIINKNLYQEKLFKQALYNLQIAQYSLREFALTKKENLTNIQVATLLGWHQAENFLKKIGKKIIQACIARILLNLKDDADNVLELIKNNPSAIACLDNKTKNSLGYLSIKSSFHSLLNSYAEKPITYFMLQQILGAWRATHQVFTSLLKVGRWANEENMPQNMLDIKRVIKRLPNEIWPNSIISENLRKTLEIIIKDREKRQSKSTKNPQSNSSKIIKALKSTASLSTKLSDESHTSLNNFNWNDQLTLIRKDLDLKKYQMTNQNHNHAERVLNTMELLVINISGKSYELSYFFENSRFKLWIPENFNYKKTCYIHLENYASWKEVKTHFSIFIDQFFNAFEIYKKTTSPTDFFTALTNEAVCIEGKTRKVMEHASYLQEMINYVDFTSLMKNHVENANAYLTTMGEEVTLKNMLEFIVSRYTNQPFIFDKIQTNTKSLIEQFGIPPGCEKSKELSIYLLNQKNVQWYLTKIGDYPEESLSPSLRRF